VPFIFIFVASPGAALASPYIYLTPPPDHEPPLPAAAAFRRTCIQPGRAHFAPPLYGQFPSPLWRVLEIIKSSLSQD